MPLKKNWYCILLLLGLVISTLSNYDNSNLFPATPSRLVRGKVANRYQIAQNTNFPNFITAILFSETLEDDLAKPLKDFILPAFSFLHQYKTDHYAIACISWVRLCISVPLYLLHCFLRI